MVTSGDLRERSFAAAVGEVIRARATGVLEVQDVIGVNRAFFLNGVPQGAKLSRLKNPLGHLLVEMGLIEEDALDRALDLHNKTEKLLGQVLLEMGVVNRENLELGMHEQSRRNFLSLFGAREGSLEFLDGLVHLTDFLPAPLSPIWALYVGARDHGGMALVEPLLARLAFSRLTISLEGRDWTTDLPDTERSICELLATPRSTAELAAAKTLSPPALGALLFALYEVGVLKLAAP